jgi:hypothetical protein
MNHKFMWSIDAFMHHEFARLYNRAFTLWNPLKNEMNYMKK